MPAADSIRFPGRSKRSGPGVRAENAAHRRARLDRPAPVRSTAPAQADHSHEIARILAGCTPLAGSVAETYLQSRGLVDPGSPDLLFNADLADFETRRGWPGMVARICDGSGEPTGGIHRTYLLDDGSAKAPPGKKMLGPVAGGSVRLSSVGDDGHLGIAEGIETALAASAIFGVATWAALSAEGLRRWQWPDGISRVTIFADAGDAGTQAAAALADRLNVAGIANAIVAPLWAEAVVRYRDGAIWWLDEPGLVASAKAEQDQRYHADAWDARIDRWLVYERRRVNHGYGNYDEWRDEEVERPNPLSEVSVGEILEGALGIEPARWTRADQMRVTAYLKARNWERYQVRKGQVREWRYRRP